MNPRPIAASLYDPDSDMGPLRAARMGAVWSPRMTEWARFVAQEETFGAWCVHVVTFADGVIRKTEPWRLFPDRQSAEHAVEAQLVKAPEVAA